MATFSQVAISLCIQERHRSVRRDVIAHVPIIVPILIGVAVAGAIGSAAYAIWQFTHTNPNWSNVSAGENITHPHWHWYKE
jgi:hypothetical protein